MEIGYALTDATTCHIRIDVAERSDEALIESISKDDNHALNNPEDLTEKKSRGAILQLCLIHHSPAQQEVIDLAYYHEKSVAEVSQIVDAPEETVTTRMHYARNRPSYSRHTASTRRASEVGKFVTSTRGVMAMRRYSIASMIVVAAGLLSAPMFAQAQTATAAPPHVHLQKSIGQAGPEIEPSLIVMNARGASLQGGKLTLIGIAPNSIVFADRPVRAAGHALTVHLLEEWAPGNQDSESFTKDPPNATVSVFSKDAAAIRDAVVVLKTPKLEGDRLTFDVDVLEGDLTGADGPASVFIDRFGFAYRGGVGRVGFGRVGVGRVGYVGRGAFYRGAAVGAAAVGAAAYGAYARPACGYYPYPPCY